MTRSLLPFLLLACMPLGAAGAGEPASYDAGKREFAAHMTGRHGFDADALREVLDQARYSQAVIDAIRRPWEAKPWFEYRAIFLTQRRITGGARFVAENRGLLERARAELGVPPAVIAAIIGIETNYGANLGSHRVIDALSTLGFAYPRRAAFFRRELEELLLLTRDEGLDPLGLVGSYAGAVGMPQFIPSSYRAYAVDFDGDGRRDLWGSRADVIGSVANYLARHGWRPGAPVAFPLALQGPLPAGLTAAESKPRRPDLPVSRLTGAGIAVPEDIGPDERVDLIRLEAPDDEFWLGMANFYVITRYNHSNLYAMAVYQLSREIQEQSRAEGATMAAGDPFD
jgi:membrane-bound lytic murein transglycosylase B